ncbi:MAG: hypothetical protein CMI55_01460 [Parcubacteria group bacterium]|jgi:prepilin-type N-terminal cleavage/methylation domain-containing protein|nr:hypothetical protein [Parcubacteria group bacterium]|tara:strand:- start:234 stop:749 length:516 start_codon:yes stop_codon:yes gene_type:complete
MKQRAFTLMEMMVVVVIIGILAVGSVFAFNKYTAAAKRNGTIAHHNTLKKWIQLQITKCSINPNAKIIYRENFSDRKSHFNCPMDAGAALPYFRSHFIYEGWKSLYSGRSPICQGCYFEGGKAVDWKIKFNVGAIQLDSIGSGDFGTFRIITYYLDQDNNYQNLTDLITVF